ncbi:hypothetical protein [Lysinibacillus xylanilyticus]
MYSEEFKAEIKEEFRQLFREELKKAFAPKPLMSSSTLEIQKHLNY